MLAQAGMTAPIIGANSVAQLNDSLAAVDLTLTPEQVKRLTKAAPWEYQGEDEEE